MAKQYANANPSGDGGYKANGAASKCPSMSSTWEVKDFTGMELPSIPQGAVKYMNKGAGKGPGLSGPGSQNAGGTSTGTASPGSASSTGSSSFSSASSSSSGSAANSLVRDGGSNAPLFVCGAVVIFSTLMGALAL